MCFYHGMLSHQPMTTILTNLVVIAAILGVLHNSPVFGAVDEGIGGQSEFREFTDALGEKVKLRLLSHKGDRKKVRVLREDGAEFDAPLENFSVSDRKYVEEWMSKTPPEIEYSFGYEFSRSRNQSISSDFGYKRVGQSNLSYEIEVTNKTRFEVGPLVFKYRLYMRNMTDGYLYDGDRGLVVIGGELKPKDRLKYAESLTLFTDHVKLDKVQYDYYYTHNRAKDALLGIILRVYDSYGRMIEEVRSSESTARTLKWVEKIDNKSKED